MTRDTQAACYWNRAARDFDAIYSGDGKNAFTRFLDVHLRADMYDRFEWVLAKAGDMRGKSVCDIGCGSGRFVTEFARRGAASVAGVDISREMLSMAGSLAERGGLERQCDFVLSDIADWNTDRTFDLTIAIGLWDYVADPLQRLIAIRKLTRSRFLSAWPRLWTWRAPVRKLRLQHLRGCPVYFYRRPRVVMLLERSGFEVQGITRIGKLFCVDAVPASCPVR
ncbi:MAG TPA: class I SAM-dependent methyltransferase [Bryobacteraceae bacterium]|nr:class I SAM-dependent methyltransferase [Bryobacteraceae bacterium]